MARLRYRFRFQNFQFIFLSTEYALGLSRTRVTMGQESSKPSSSSSSVAGTDGLKPMDPETEALQQEFDSIIYNCDDEVAEMSLEFNRSGKDSPKFLAVMERYKKCIASRDERLSIVRTACQDKLEAFNTASAAAGGDATYCNTELRGLVTCARTALEERQASAAKD